LVAAAGLAASLTTGALGAAVVELVAGLAAELFYFSLSALAF